MCDGSREATVLCWISATCWMKYWAQVVQPESMRPSSGLTNDGCNKVAEGAKCGEEQRTDG